MDTNPGMIPSNDLNTIDFKYDYQTFTITLVSTVSVLFIPCRYV
jgi:hypothetical protein